MKELKIIVAILITFVIVIGTSALLDIPFFSSCWPRYGCIVLLMVVELCVGFMYVKNEAINLKPEQE